MPLFPDPPARKDHISANVGAAFFATHGYLGPYRCYPEALMCRLRDRIVDDVIGPAAGQIGEEVQCRHLDNRDVYDLCTNRVIVSRMAHLLGEDLVLWRSNFWCKQPGGAEVPWHQDLTNWPLDPVINVSAWLALDPATAANGCVQLIPGSHKSTYPTIGDKGDPLGERVPELFIDPSRVVNMELAPGEFFLFSEKLLHHSEANTSTHRRLGLAIRMTTPEVRVDHAQLCGGAHRNILVRGADRYGLNLLQGPPGHDD